MLRRTDKQIAQAVQKAKADMAPDTLKDPVAVPNDYRPHGSDPYDSDPHGYDPLGGGTTVNYVNNPAWKSGCPGGWTKMTNQHGMVAAHCPEGCCIQTGNTGTSIQLGATCDGGRCYQKGISGGASCNGGYCYQQMISGDVSCKKGGCTKGFP